MNFQSLEAEGFSSNDDGVTFFMNRPVAKGGDDQ